MSIKLYKVGGCVRDAVLGLKSKDVDYAVEAGSFEEMLSYIQNISGSRIFLSTPEFFTVRALVRGEAADYRLCRKEGPYYDNRHPSYVEVSSIYDDLSTRDFTFNAMAIDEDTGELIDPFGGQKDLEDKIIRCVGNPEDRFREDALRILRAIRFCIRFGFNFDLDTELAMLRLAPNVLSVSAERIREELEKCFRMDTVRTVTLLVRLRIFESLFSADTGLWLLPTNKER